MMHMRQYTGAILAIVLILALALTGCGSNKTESQGGSNSGNSGNHSDNSPGKPVTITFWDENSGPQRTPHYEELIKRFEAAHPNIKVEYVGLPASSAKQKYDVAIASDDMPDIGGINQFWISDFVAKGVLLDLEDYFSSWSEKDKIAASAIDGSRSSAPDGKLYQIPNTSNYSTLWYRADWFEDAGIGVPQTFDEFFATADALTDSAKDRYGFTIRGGSGSSKQLTEILYAYSGITDYFDQDGKATVNDPAHVEFLNQYVQLYGTNTPTSDVTNGYKEMVAVFDTGIAAMLQHNLGSYGEHTKAFGANAAEFKASPLPKSQQGYRVITGGDNVGLAIFKSSKHKDAAWKFLTFLASEESQNYWNQNIGQMPTHIDSLNSDWVKSSQHILALSEAIADPATKVLIPPIYLPDYSSIQLNVLEPGFQSVLLGKVSPQDFLDEWAQAMEAALAEYQNSFE
ncbi:ABC transporter substrate-binding protein [Paenibacillus woosongensis]|uniref:Sugar-binding protein n=1 Tax=Paenibacillus woosongensis TaxID=307580 RepID=A0ABQ4MZ72_9BACL|nr:sugar ABC transporter substrate-binding protein [Paenibacillus woosongensis]GIP61236.1 sugar-binding protein [Paenibacillus woosongensis]